VAKFRLVVRQIIDVKGEIARRTPGKEHGEMQEIKTGDLLLDGHIDEIELELDYPGAEENDAAEEVLNLALRRDDLHRGHEQRKAARKESQQG